jgi:aromatic ring-cleaving dioxygenase
VLWHGRGNQQKEQAMSDQEQKTQAHFERVDHPACLPGQVVYSISDSSTHTVELSPQEAYDLLAWLERRREELQRLVHPVVAQQELSLHVQEISPSDKVSLHCSARYEHEETIHALSTSFHKRQKARWDEKAGFL